MYDLLPYGPLTALDALDRHDEVPALNGDHRCRQVLRFLRLIRLPVGGPVVDERPEVGPHAPVGTERVAVELVVEGELPPGGDLRRGDRRTAVPRAAVGPLSGDVPGPPRFRCPNLRGSRTPASSPGALLASPRRQPPWRSRRDRCRPGSASGRPRRADRRRANPGRPATGSTSRRRGGRREPPHRGLQRIDSQSRSSGPSVCLPSGGPSQLPCHGESWRAMATNPCIRAFWRAFRFRGCRGRGGAGPRSAGVPAPRWRRRMLRACDRAATQRALEGTSNAHAMPTRFRTPQSTQSLKRRPVVAISS